MLSDRCPVCLSCLSVTLVYCGQTVGWMKIKLGMEVGLGLGDIVRWGPSSSPKGGRNSSPHFSAHVFGQTAGWIKMPLGMNVGLGPGHTVLDRDPAPPQRKVAQHTPLFYLCLLWPNGWMGQDANCYGGRSWPSHIVLDGDPAPNFWPTSVMAKRLDGSRYHLVGMKTSGQTILC